VAQQLITFPFRVGFRVAGVFVKAAGGAVGLAGRIVRPSSATESRDADAATTQVDEAPATDQPEVVEPDATEAEQTVAAAPVRDEAEQLPPLSDEPTHVSEEPELVEEFAEPGAEEGAGATVEVEEPWKGYDQLNAQEVIARLENADAAEIAAVQLYEHRNRQRETVLAAAERRLALTTRGGSN